MKGRQSITPQQKVIASNQELPLETIAGRPSYLHRLNLLARYGSASVAATSADFAVFHTAMAYLGVSPVLATILGRSVGSLVAFLLHRSWVFRHAQSKDGHQLRLRYVMGILLGMGLNAGGVWLLNSLADVDPWPARIATATSVWLFGFVFNNKIVFGKGEKRGEVS